MYKPKDKTFFEQLKNKFTRRPCMCFNACMSGRTHVLMSLHELKDASVCMEHLHFLVLARLHVFWSFGPVTVSSRCYLCSTVDTPISSPLCWNISLFSLMKFFCISDICAMIFSLRSRAISAFLFLSAFSFSLMSCRDRTAHRQPLVLVRELHVSREESPTS